MKIIVKKEGRSWVAVFHGWGMHLGDKKITTAYLSTMPAYIVIDAIQARNPDAVVVRG